MLKKAATYLLILALAVPAIGFGPAQKTAQSAEI
jgi:hypothetical protein